MLEREQKMIRKIWNLLNATIWLFFCTAVMICKNSELCMDDHPSLMYSLSFNKKRQKWQSMHYECRPTFTDVFSDFASALNVRSRSSRSSSSSKSSCNRMFLTILFLTEQKHLYSPSRKRSCIVMSQYVNTPFQQQNMSREHFSHFNSKKSVFCQGEKKF